MRREFSTSVLLACWVMLFVRTVEAATLSDFMGIEYSADNVQWAAVTAVLGGGLRTIFSLQSDGRVVRQIAAEAVWDAAKALVAGLLAFVIVQSLRSMDMSIPSEVRFSAVLVAGWSRMATLEWFERFLKDRGKKLMGGDFSSSKKGDL